MAANAPPSGRPWLNLPLDLALLVHRRLPSKGDRISFSAVCPLWCAAAKHAPPEPRLVLPDGAAYSLFPCDEPLRLPRCAGYEDAGGNRLVFWSEDDDGGTDLLVNPLSDDDAAAITLPAALRARVQSVENATTNTNEDLTMAFHMFCSPRLVAARTGLWRSPCQIAVCRPGVDSWWSVLDIGGNDGSLADMAFHADELYVLNYPKGALYHAEIATDRGTGDPSITGARRVIDGGGFPGTEYQLEGSGNVAVRTMYLVGSRGGGNLLMVLRTAYGVWSGGVVEADKRRSEFRVFRADLGRSRWTETTTLGDDRVLFLRRRCSRIVPASQIDVPGDCIVFIENDDEDKQLYGTDSTCSCSIYSMKRATVSPFMPAVSWRHGVDGFATWLFTKDD